MAEKQETQLVPAKEVKKETVKKEIEKKLSGKIEKKELSITELALNPDINIDKLKLLIDLRNKEEERLCKKEFYKHFAEMQSEFKPIGKSKKGYEFHYATLGEMESEFRPIISKHGFSYTWINEEIPEKPEYNRVRIIVSGWGYTNDQVYFDVPKIELSEKQDNRINAIQKDGIRSTYGQRYTFKMAFGITEIGEDTDGNLSFEDGVNYVELEQRLSACTTIEAVNAEANTMKKELVEKNDNHGIEVLRVLYMRRKKELVK